MAVQIITYENKQYLNENASIPAINKVQDTDMNEIKSVVNNNANNIGDLTNLQTSSTDNLVNAINTRILKALWENSNPTSDFSSQTITLSSDDYDYLIIFWLNYKTTNRLDTTFTLKNYGAYLSLAGDYSPGGGNYYVASYIREFTRTSDTSFNFGDCYVRYGNSTTRPTSNANIIPVAIYGGKF